MTVQCRFFDYVSTSPGNYPHAKFDFLTYRVHLHSNLLCRRTAAAERCSDDGR